jgi:hypothetical protein
MAFWYILWIVGIFCGNLVYFSRFVILCQEKYGNPGFECGQKRRIVAKEVNLETAPNCKNGSTTINLNFGWASFRIRFLSGSALLEQFVLKVCPNSLF